MTTTWDAALKASDAFIAFGQVLVADRAFANVRDYAIDGLITEQSLLNALAVNDTVFIPRDVQIDVAETIYLVSDKRIFGSGVLRPAANRPTGWVMFALASKTNVTIEGIGINAYTTAQTSPLDAIRVSGPSTFIRVRDVAFDGWQYAVASPADGQFRVSCEVVGCSIIGGTGGISATSWSNSRIERNFCHDQSHFGISIYNGRNTRVHRNEISRTGRTSSSSAGISAATAQDCDITSNRIHDTACHGIRLDTNAHRTRVSRNRLTNIGVVDGLIPPGSGSSCGVAAWEGSAGAFSIGVKIDHNVMKTIAGYGISAHWGLNDIYIGGNEIEGVGDPGISVQASGRIVANRVKNTDGPGIVLGWDDDNANTNQAVDQIVALNEIGPTGMAGIHVNGAKRFLIKDNTIAQSGIVLLQSDGQQSGIFLVATHPASLLPTTDGIVSSNIIRDATGYGIYRATGPTVLVDRNILLDNALGEDWP